MIGKMLDINFFKVTKFINSDKTASKEKHLVIKYGTRSDLLKVGKLPILSNQLTRLLRSSGIKQNFRKHFLKLKIILVSTD